jgi:hypothetical protein
VKNLLNSFHSVSVFQVDRDLRAKGIDHAFSFRGRSCSLELAFSSEGDDGLPRKFVC